MEGNIVEGSKLLLFHQSSWLQSFGATACTCLDAGPPIGEDTEEAWETLEFSAGLAGKR